MFIMDKFKIPFDSSLSKQTYEEAKQMYKKAFGTENIIVIDEENFLNKMEGESMNQSAAPNIFFHNDMIFSQSGNKIFLSSPGLSAEIMGFKYNQDIDEMFERIGKQFKDLGFAVVEVPFANNDLNYVNVIPYTDKNTHKPTVIFPSYHFDPEDIKGKYMDEVS